MYQSVILALGRFSRQERQQALTLLVMTLAMGLVLSAFLTLQAHGMREGFVAAWARRFASSYVVVLPLVAILSPIARSAAGFIDRRLFPQRVGDEEEIADSRR